MFAAPPPISILSSNDEGLGNTNCFQNILDGVNRSQQLLGDMCGLRRDLSKYGIELAVQETSEGLGNLTGGVHRGFAYDGLTQVLLQMDTQRAFGWYGGTFNVSGLNIHGRNLSQYNLLSLQTASGIEADRSTRLWELWYQQKLLDEDRLSIKIGQQSLDQEFMVSSNALYFVNTMFGWPMLPSADMPGGGPAYPLSNLGIRFNYKPVDGINILGGLFNGSPVNHDNGTDPQRQDFRGTSFPLGQGQLAIAEIQFSYPSLGSMVSPGEIQPLGWTYRLGAWYDSQRFADQRYDDTGTPLASSNSDGQPHLHKGNYAFYGVVDKLVWRDDSDPNRTIGVFARAMGTPLHDRNLIDSSLNIGAVMHSPFHYRTDDTVGIGAGYAHVSSSAVGLDADNYANGNESSDIIRHHETFIELTYQYQLKPWIQIQPDIQYVFNPGGNIANPNDPTTKIHNELVLGLRTNISF